MGIEQSAGNLPTVYCRRNRLYSRSVAIMLLLQCCNLRSLDQAIMPDNSCYYYIVFIGIKLYVQNKYKIKDVRQSNLKISLLDFNNFNF